MSFDISVHRIINGEAPPCNKDEADACIKLLRSINQETPDEFGFLYLEFEDGSGTEVSIWKDPAEITHCTFFTRGLSKKLLEFIYNMALAGNMVILNMQAEDSSENPTAMAPNQNILDNMGDAGFENIALCESPEKLAQMIDGSFGDWADFRDHALQEEPKKKSFFKRLFGRQS